MAGGGEGTGQASPVRGPGEEVCSLFSLLPVVFIGENRVSCISCRHFTIHGHQTVALRTLHSHSEACQSLLSDAGHITKNLRRDLGFEVCRGSSMEGPTASEALETQVGAAAGGGGGLWKGKNTLQGESVLEVPNLELSDLQGNLRSRGDLIRGVLTMGEKLMAGYLAVKVGTSF